MILNKDCLLKGYYKHTQLTGFISVKQYMFIRKKGKKCLIQRFSNDSDFAVNAIEYLVSELDAEGNVIKTDRVRSSGFSALPGEVFAPADGLVVSENCVDYKVRFISCVSGRYKYLIKNGQPTPIYDRLGYVRRTGKDSILAGNLTVNTHRVKDKRLYSFIALVAILCMMAVAFIGALEESSQLSRLSPPDSGVTDEGGSDSSGDNPDNIYSE